MIIASVESKHRGPDFFAWSAGRLYFVIVAFPGYFYLYFVRYDQDY